MAARIEAAAVRYPLRFVVAGDSGAWPDPTADGIFARLVRQVSELDLKPLFFAHLGDFAGPGTSERHEHYLRLVDRLRIPNVCLVENHDLDDETGAETFIRIHGPFNFTFAHGHTRFVALRAIPNEGPGDKDLAYLHRTLTGARESHRVVLKHMPPSMDAHFEPHPEWGFTGREQQFFDLLHEHRVRLVLCARLGFRRAHIPPRPHRYVGRCRHRPLLSPAWNLHHRYRSSGGPRLPFSRRRGHYQRAWLHFWTGHPGVRRVGRCRPHRVRRRLTIANRR